MKINIIGVTALAIMEAEKLGHTYIGTEHFLLSVCGLLDPIGNLRKKVYNEIVSYIGKGSPTTLNKEFITPTMKKVLSEPINSLDDLFEKICTGDTTAKLILKRMGYNI